MSARHLRFAGVRADDPLTHVLGPDRRLADLEFYVGVTGALPAPIGHEGRKRAEAMHQDVRRAKANVAREGDVRETRGVGSLTYEAGVASRP